MQWSLSGFPPAITSLNFLQKGHKNWVLVHFLVTGPHLEGRASLLVAGVAMIII
jgi:hypothetical protein